MDIDKMRKKYVSPMISETSVVQDEPLLVGSPACVTGVYTDGQEIEEYDSDDFEWEL